MSLSDCAQPQYLASSPFSLGAHAPQKRKERTTSHIKPLDYPSQLKPHPAEATVPWEE